MVYLLQQPKVTKTTEIYSETILTKGSLINLALIQGFSTLSLCYLELNHFFFFFQNHFVEV